MPCVHEFCIMPQDPGPEEEFTYTPEKFPDQAVVDDDDLNEWAGRHRDALWSIPVYYHERSRPDVGLSWYGITLIPPESLPALEEIVLSDRRIQTDEQLVELSRVLREAIRRKKHMIHFGV